MDLGNVRKLVQKYSTSGPRYTSYPTAPQWTENFGLAGYKKHLELEDNPQEPLALYIHVPFCESLCYYCGCNIQITKDHSRSGQYVDALLKEIKTVAGFLQGRRHLSQISWGGGTPTFLALSEMQRLHQGTRDYFDIAPEAEVSIEIDPRVTSQAQLETLRELGFNRVSLGLQDFNETVQKSVNRLQSKEMTEGMIQFCRKLGYQGINLDLIYGLPHQTVDSFKHTIQTVAEVRPDRIALYNYAHLPSLRGHQKILDKLPMPNADERLDIFSLSYDHLTRAGYRSIGMDHFALPQDELSKALDSGSLYRNFMGYTVKRGAGLIGIGASAIGEMKNTYFQNIREAKGYEEAIAKDGVATFRGCLLSEEDKKRKWIIQRLMCNFQLKFSEYRAKFGDSFEEHFSEEVKTLIPFYEDGILTRSQESLKVTPLGQLFVRVVAMAFDAYLKSPKGATYSKTL